MAGQPQPPPDFDDAAHRLWLYTLRALCEQGTWQDSDRHALERYVRALTLARQGRELLAGEGLTTTGARGQVVAHPVARITRDAENDAAAFARDLLLTPRARRLAGITESSAMDDELRELLRD